MSDNLNLKDHRIHALIKKNENSNRDLNPPETFNVMGKQGASCDTTCKVEGLVCNTHTVTRNKAKAMNRVGPPFCYTPKTSRTYFSKDQPAYVSDPSDANYRKCIGYVNVPDKIVCGATYRTSRRLCTCDNSGLR